MLPPGRRALLASRTSTAASRPAVRGRPVTGPGRAEPDVTAVILTHDADPDTLRDCVASVARQDRPVQILLADNGAGVGRPLPEDVARAYAGRRLSLAQNRGFADGINRALSHVTTPFALVLNDDTVLDMGAADAMRRALEGDARAVAVAPKIFLAGHPLVLDAVGTVVRPDGLAFNRGIGQLDIGQYDDARPVFGASFAACLLRRSAFDEGEVGPLEDRFFMYYEDVDWCYRAGLRGWRVLSAPDAIVHHQHGHTARRRPDGFRHYFLYRNPLWLALRNFEAGGAARALGRRLAATASRALRGPHRRAATRALRDFARGVPAHWQARRRIQAQRRVPDTALLGHAEGEVPCFDHDRCEPRADFGTLAAMYARRCAARPADGDRRIADLARKLATGPARPALQAELLGLLSREPEPVRGFAEGLLGVSATGAACPARGREGLV